MKKHFFYIGVPKAGSTWLYKILESHKDIFIPKLKELHFFGKNKKFQDYKSYFKHSNNEENYGDFSTGYIFEESALKEIKENIPDAKLIIFFRNPLERDFSAFLHLKRFKNVSFSFIDFISNKELCEQWYSRGSEYKKMVNRVEKFFDKDQIFYGLYDDIIDHPNRLINEILEFLNIDAQNKSELIKSKFNESKISRNYILIRVAYYIKLSLIKFRMFSFYTFLRDNSLLKKLLFTKNNINKDYSLHKYKNYIYKYNEDIEIVEKVTLRQLDKWRNL